MTDRLGIDDRVLVVAGKLVVDEVLHLAAPLVPGSQQRAAERRVTGGGQVWHTGRAAAAAGAVVRVTGRCGPDAESDALRRELARAGIEDRLVASDATPRAIVLVEPDGERTIVSTGGDGTLPAGAIDATAVLADAGWLHLDGYALDPVSGDALVRLARTAAASGVPVSLEPPSVASLASRLGWLAALPPLACLLGRPDEAEAAQPVLCAVPEAVVLHDQANPVVVRSPEAEVSLAARPDAPATLGAGDRFAGGVLAARLRGASWADAARAGIAAAHA